MYGVHIIADWNTKSISSLNLPPTRHSNSRKRAKGHGFVCPRRSDSVRNILLHEAGSWYHKASSRSQNLPSFTVWYITSQTRPLEAIVPSNAASSNGALLLPLRLPLPTFPNSIPTPDMPVTEDLCGLGIKEIDCYITSTTSHTPKGYPIQPQFNY